MKSMIVAEIERIAGSRLTPAMREEIADRAIKIIDDHNKTVAIAALESAKGTLVDAAAKETKNDPLKGGFP
jgi:hypothetical protein